MSLYVKFHFIALTIPQKQGQLEEVDRRTDIGPYRPFHPFEKKIVRWKPTLCLPPLLACLQDNPMFKIRHYSLVHTELDVKITIRKYITNVFVILGRSRAPIRLDL